MPDLPPGPTPGPAATPPHLPARLPQTTALLRRAQGTLEVLRGGVQESSAEYWYERGKKAGAAGDWAEAEHAFERCVRLDAEHWRGLLQLAYCYSEQQQLQPTLSGLRRAYDSTAPRFEVFCKELEISQWKQLKSLWLENPAATNEYYDLLFALALVNYAIKYSFPFHTEGRSGGARDLLDELNALYPQRVEIDKLWFKLSGCLRQYEWSDGFGSSLNDLEKAVALGADNAYTYFLMGVAWYKQCGCNYNTVYGLDKCIEMANDNVFHGYKSLVRKKLKNYIGALYDVNVMLEFEPNNFIARSSKVDLMIELEDFENSLQDLNWLIENWTGGDGLFEHSNHFKQRALARRFAGDISGAEMDEVEAERLCKIAWIDDDLSHPWD